MDTLKGEVDYSQVLRKDNVDEYIPSDDYNPTTKKYVDDKHVFTEGKQGISPFHFYGPKELLETVITIKQPEDLTTTVELSFIDYLTDIISEEKDLEYIKTYTKEIIDNIEEPIKTVVGNSTWAITYSIESIGSIRINVIKGEITVIIINNIICGFTALYNRIQDSFADINSINEVHIGAKEPTGEETIWIDPTEEADKIPTKISELENDSRFVNEEYVDNIVGDIETTLDNIISTQESYIGGVVE